MTAPTVAMRAVARRSGCAPGPGAAAGFVTDVSGALVTARPGSDEVETSLGGQGLDDLLDLLGSFRVG